MCELKDKYIRFDWAIKRLLRQKANFGVREGFSITTWARGRTTSITARTASWACTATTSCA